MRFRLVLLAAFVMLWGCGSDGDPSEEGAAATGTSGVSTTTTSTAPAADDATTTSIALLAPAAETRTLTMDGVERTYILYVPSSVDPGVGAPVALALHGGGGNAGQIIDQAVLVAAEREGFIIASPDALVGPDGFTNWTKTDDSDVRFMTAIVDDIASTTAVDPRRIYSMGFSAGGDFSLFLTCSDPGTYAAVASIAAMNHHTEACDENHPARVLAFVGRSDTIYSIERGLTLDVDAPDKPGPLEEELNGWATTNGCDLPPVTSEPAPDVELREYDCATGALVVYIHPGGHVLPRLQTEGIDALDLILDFLAEYTTDA